LVVQVLLRGTTDPGTSKSTSKTVAKSAEQQRRRELEAGFHNISEVRQQRIRSLKEIIDEYLVGYRLRYRAARFAMTPANGQAIDARGPVDHKFTAEIESFRNTLGEHIYAEILRRAGHSRDARAIPNAERQKNVMEWMQATARGFKRLHTLAELAGNAQFTATMRKLNIVSIRHLPSLAALKQLGCVNTIFDIIGVNGDHR
jgi:hypothetical protein